MPYNIICEAYSHVRRICLAYARHVQHMRGMCSICGAYARHARMFGAYDSYMPCICEACAVYARHVQHVRGICSFYTSDSHTWVCGICWAYVAYARHMLHIQHMPRICCVCDRIYGICEAYAVYARHASHMPHMLACLKHSAVLLPGGRWILMFGLERNCSIIVLF